MVSRLSKLVVGLLCAGSVSLVVATTSAPVNAEDPPAPAQKIEFSDQAFIDAAYDNCATVENRSAKSCGCERKLIGDRVNADDKKMAFYYWTDKEKFTGLFEAKRKADATWHKGFSERFSNLQALIIAACGT